MLQRTDSRSRARSQANFSPTEDDDLLVALQRLLDKLRLHQPLFTEDDVSAIPYPAEGSSGGGNGVTPPHMPIPAVPCHSPSTSGNENATRDDASGRTAAPRVFLRSMIEATASQPTSSSVSASGNSINLDVPLSSGLFLTAVNLFESKTLSKSKRAAVEVIKLIRQAYALVWKDPGYLSGFPDGETNVTSCGSSRSTSIAGTVGTSVLQRRRHGPVTCAITTRTSPPTGGALFPSFAPSPAHKPNQRLVLLLDECIRTLLVYANVSMFLCHSVATNTHTLLLFAFVACAARRQEEHDVINDGGYASAADVVAGNRNLRAEMESLEEVWRSCGIEGRMVEYLRECYLIEFLLDAALPPAVCSARYDGLQMSVYEKKQRVISDVVASRTGFSKMMKLAPLRGLGGLVNMSAFGTPKLRARLLDKMAMEGVVERLATEIAVAMEVMLDLNSSATPNCSPSKRPRSSYPREGSPQRQRSCSENSDPSHFNTLPNGRTPHKGDVRGDAPPVEFGMERRTSTALERMLNTEPTPMERIGQCIDILTLLSSPNLRQPEANDASPPRGSSPTASSVLRSTSWASHDGALHDISLHLLAICVLSKTHLRYSELASLQVCAADCVLQWAAYNGAYYAMVVHTMDVLLDMMEAAATSPPQVSRSPSPPSTQAPEGNEIRIQHKDTRSRRLLLRLLPGDEVGLLPLIIRLLQYTVHAEANAGSIQRWFRFLADRLLTNVFEAPLLTNGRRSTTAWGLRHHQRRHGAEMCPTARSCTPSQPRASSQGALLGLQVALDTPALARDPTRTEVVAAAPYFCFVRQVMEETSWRDGTQPLFSKVTLLAAHVIVTQGHRCNLLFGQACACYDVVAPVLLNTSTPSGRGKDASAGFTSPRYSWRSSLSSGSTTYRRSTFLMHQREEEEEERTKKQSKPSPGEGFKSRFTARESGEADDDEVFIGSASADRSPPARRRGSGSPRKDGSPANRRSEETKEGLSPFIASPSRSLKFYDAFTPKATEISSGSRSDDLEQRHSSSPGLPRDAQHGTNLLAALEAVVAVPGTSAPSASVSATEPPAVAAYSWAGRLSIRSFLASISGFSEAPLLEVEKCSKRE